MGLGKIARGLGKVGLAIEAARYAWIGGKALWEAVRGDPAARRDDMRQDRPTSIEGAAFDQDDGPLP